MTIQFTRNNLSASMFDLSMKDKPRSPFSKLKDKVKGKKKYDLESASAILPSSALEDPELGSLGKMGKAKGFFLRNKLRKSSLTQSNTSLGSDSTLSSTSGSLVYQGPGAELLTRSPSHSSWLSTEGGEQRERVGSSGRETGPLFQVLTVIFPFQVGTLYSPPSCSPTRGHTVMRPASFEQLLPGPFLSSKATLIVPPALPSASMGAMCTMRNLSPPYGTGAPSQAPFHPRAPYTVFHLGPLRRGLGPRMTLGAEAAMAPAA